jgi:hypothetical protein
MESKQLSKVQSKWVQSLDWSLTCLPHTAFWRVRGSQGRGPRTLPAEILWRVSPFVCHVGREANLELERG